MKSTRYFIIEPPEFTDVKWQLAATQDKCSFKEALKANKFTVVYASKSKHATLFMAGKLGIQVITIVGETVRKESCKNVTYETSCLMLQPSLHPALAKIMNAAFFNERSATWCIPTPQLSKDQVRALKQLKVPNALNSEFIILQRN